MAAAYTPASGASANVTGDGRRAYHAAVTRSADAMASSRALFARAGLGRERDVHDARLARGFHHVDDGLVSGAGIRVDDDDRVLRVAGGAPQLVRERGGVGPGEHGLLDHVAALRVD